MPLIYVLSDFWQNMNFKSHKWFWNNSDMSDYEGLSRVVIIKKKKSDGLGFKLKNDPKRKGNVSQKSSPTEFLTWLKSSELLINLKLDCIRCFINRTSWKMRFACWRSNHYDQKEKCSKFKARRCCCRDQKVCQEGHYSIHRCRSCMWPCQSRSRWNGWKFWRKDFQCSKNWNIIWLFTFNRPVFKLSIFHSLGATCFDNTI